MPRTDTTPPFEPERGHPNAFPEHHPYSDKDVRRALSHPENDVGGGQSYGTIHTPEDADVVVSEASELQRVSSGQTAYIADNEVIDLDSPYDNSGKELIGGRGRTGVHAGMIRFTEAGSSAGAHRGIIRMDNGAGHIEGIRIQGPSWYPDRAAEWRDRDPQSGWALPGFEPITGQGKSTRSERDAERAAVNSRGINMYSGGCTVRNTEVRGFTQAGICSGAKNYTPQNTVTDCHLHNSCMPSLGYPISVLNGELTSKRNYYNAYRHAITGFGRAEMGYTMEQDIIGPDCLLTAIDMHNVSENGGSSIVAGSFMRVNRSLWLPKYRMDCPDWYNSKETSVMHSRGYAAIDDGYEATNTRSVQEPRERACAHSNVGADQWVDWVFENNEFGQGNWTGDASIGAPVDLDIEGGGGVSPEQPDTTVSRRELAERRRARTAAVAEHLGELGTALK